MTAFFLNAFPPFSLGFTAWALRRLPVNSIDRWDGHVYSRTLAIDGNAIEISVKETGNVKTPELLVTLDGPSKYKRAVSDTLRRTLGLDIDLTAFYEMASRHRLLNSLAKRFYGFKPPRFPSVFEALINGVACQQISLPVGILLLSRLSAAYGLSKKGHHAFPRPQDLVSIGPRGLRKLGYSTRKSENIIYIANAVYRGELGLESLENEADSAAVSRLLELPGIGRWTAEYIMLRGLGRLDIFPADDVGGQKKVMRWLGLKERPDYLSMHKALDRWSPYRGLLYFLLLLDNLSREGLL